MFTTIEKLEPASVDLNTPMRYVPVRDPGENRHGYGGLSLALVAFMAAPCAESKGFVEVLVTLGAGITAAMDEDSVAVCDSFIDVLEGSQDGLYVIECAWDFSPLDPSDSEFEVLGKRKLTPEERTLISEERAFDAVVSKWGSAYAEIQCCCCRKLGREHSLVYLNCPTVGEEHGTP